MKKEEKSNKLTEAEEKFCELYIYGGLDYAGQLVKCYEEAFGYENKNVKVKSRKLLSEPHILSKLKELTGTIQNEIEHTAIKLQITETLKAVMEETATASYEDKFGVSLSPAPLRAVSVNAAKALMELYPVKHVHETRLKIEGNNGGITFNVVVPEAKPNEKRET